MPCADSAAASSSAAAKIAGSLPAATTWTSAGETSRGQQSPLSSRVPSAIAATARDGPIP